MFIVGTGKKNLNENSSLRGGLFFIISFTNLQEMRKIKKANLADNFKLKLIK